MVRPSLWASSLWCLCLGLCLLPASGVHVSAARVSGPANPVQWPTGPEVNPVGRHIQYCWLNHPHGLTDRMWMFRTLVALGKLHNATVHIKGGGPRIWLHEMHSADAAESWSRYFDMQANDGNPWHELVNFRGCATLGGQYKNSDLLRLFDSGALCVNIVSQLPPNEHLPREFAAVEPDLPVSTFVKSAANRFLRRYKVEKTYGSCHIRRCDRLQSNANCTAPHKIYEQLARGQQLQTWLFFMYAEEAYSRALRARLAPLGRRLLFEDEVVLNDVFPEDNYFTYLLGKYLNGGAQMIVETHLCTGSGRPTVFFGSSISSHGIFMVRNTRESEVMEGDSYELQDTFSAAEDEYSAVCTNATKGARLVKDTPQLQNKWSTSPV